MRYNVKFNHIARWDENCIPTIVTTREGKHLTKEDIMELLNNPTVVSLTIKNTRYKGMRQPYPVLRGIK